MAVTASPPIPPKVKVTLERWLEDRAADVGIESLADLALAAGMTKNKLTLCFENPEKAHANEVMGLATALRLHWFEDLVRPWGFGKIRISLDEAAQLAKEEGYEIGLIVNTAA